MKKLIRMAIVAIAVIALGATIMNGIAWDELRSNSEPAMAYNQVEQSQTETEVVQTTETQPTVSAAPSAWYHFFNTDLQGEDSEDDFNFGPNPIQQGLTAKEYDQIFRETVRADPAIGAANLAWFDAKVGTRYLGEFYDSCKQDWAKTMNEAKLKFMADQGLYNRTLDAWFSYLDSAVTEITVFHATSGIVDQMYMNPFTVDGVPDIVVLKTLQSQGDFLKYKLQIKGSSETTDGNGSAQEISFMTRIDCRFQPSNVAQVMKITPQPQPTKQTPTTTPTKPTPTTPTKPTPTTPSKPTPTTPSKPTPTTPSKPTPTTPSKPTPTTPSKPTPTTPSKPTPTTPSKPTPTPVPSYNKDKTKGTTGDVVKPNDNPGTGPNTNNGVGSTTSSKDKPTNSGNGMTYPEYKQEVQEIKEVNQTQRTGKDNNTPSYTPPSTTVTTKDSTGKTTTTTTTKPTVDNNGDKGNGSQSAPINNPTPVVQPAKSAETNKPITNTESNPAGEWSGPPD